MLGRDVVTFGSLQPRAKTKNAQKVSSDWGNLIDNLIVSET